MQEALAQMESNAAAAMAKFKSFSRPSSSPKATTKDSASAKEALDKTVEEELASPSSQQQAGQKTSLTASQGKTCPRYHLRCKLTLNMQAKTDRQWTASEHAWTWL